MVDVLKRNSTFYFLFLPVLIVGTIVFKYGGLLILLAGLIFFSLKRRYDLIIITFIVVLIFSDNLNPEFDFFKNMRILILLYSLVLSLSIIIVYEKGFDRRILFFLPFFGIGFYSSYVFSPDLSSSIIRDISYFILVITIFTFFRYTYQKEKEELTENLILLMYLVFGTSLIGILPGLNSFFFVGDRLSGLMGNPNGLALLSIMCFPLVDYLDAKNETIPAPVFKFLKLLILVCLFLTGSRNGLISLFIYVVLHALLAGGLFEKYVAVLAIVASLIVFINLQSILQSVPELQDYTRAQTLENASGRVQVWAVAMQEIERNPWVGNGNYYYNIYFDNYARMYGLVARQWFSVWNSYLAILLDAGMLGLLAYLFFLIGVILFGGNFKWVVPFVTMALFSAVFESWLVASLNAITPMFLFYFIVTQNEPENEDYSIV